jgi:hypothetical protein
MGRSTTDAGKRGDIAASHKDHGGGKAVGQAYRQSYDPYPRFPVSWRPGLTIRTGPLEALKTLVETLPTRNRCTAPRPRLPTAMSALSGAPSSAASIRDAAGFPTDILARGRI